MPGGPIKTVLFFQQGATGWSETYYTNDASLEAFVGALATRWLPGTKFSALFEQRRALLTTQCRISHARSTDLTTGGTLPYTPPGYTGTGLYPGKEQGGGGAPTEVWSSLMMLLYSGTIRPRRLYLGGVPEELVLSPQFYQRNGIWTPVMTNFKALLTAGSYGWTTRPKVGPNDLPITSFITQAGGRTALVSPAPRPGTLPATWYVLIRGLDSPRGWNGVHRAQVGPDVGSMIIGPAKRPGVSVPLYVPNPKATVGVFLQSFVQIDGVDDVKIVNKKRGRPFGQLRGRR